MEILKGKIAENLRKAAILIEHHKTQISSKVLNGKIHITLDTHRGTQQQQHENDGRDSGQYILMTALRIIKLHDIYEQRCEQMESEI